MAKTATQKVEKVDSQEEVKNINESESKNELDVSTLLEIINSLKKEVETLKTKNEISDSFSNYLKNTNNDEFVTIVNTSVGTIHGKFQTWEFRMVKYGQKQTISKTNFYELFNNKYSWFEKRYLALDSKYMDYAKEIGCPIYDENNRNTITPEDMEKWGDMGEYDIEKYYNSISNDMKASFASYFMGKCYEKDSKFYNINKMNIMNRLTESNMFDNLIIACQNSFTKNK